MSNELTVIAIALVGFIFNYFWLFPKVAKNNLKKMAWLDLLAIVPVFGIITLLFYGSNERFSLIFFDTNWFIFSIVIYAVIEIPLFSWYLKSRNLGREYLNEFKDGFTGDWFTGTTQKAVSKQLNDTRWNWIRTPKAQSRLVITSNIAIISGTVFLAFVGDNKWSSLALLHIIIIGVVWSLLRQSTRLIADAPNHALDERTIRERNRSHFHAYRILGTLIMAGLVGLMIFAIRADVQNTSIDGFYYNLELTWPQVQGIFWFYWAYAITLPSMVLAWKQSKASAYVDR